MNASTTEVMAETESGLTFTRYFVASARVVFDYWTKPRLLRHWWGPEAARLAAATIEVRPGGALELVLRGAGGEEVVERGRFLELRPPHRLTFSLERSDLPGETLFTSVSIEETGAMVQLTVQQSRATGEPWAHRQEPEWLEALTRLAECLE
jgi:uncharacterized protein YndB with AHSA1/START domain